MIPKELFKSCIKRARQNRQIIWWLAADSEEKASLQILAFPFTSYTRIVSHLLRNAFDAPGSQTVDIREAAVDRRLSWNYPHSEKEASKIVSVRGR